jgi:hypothetical protein
MIVSTINPQRQSLFFTKIRRPYNGFGIRFGQDDEAPRYEPAPEPEPRYEPAPEPEPQYEPAPDTSAQDAADNIARQQEEQRQAEINLAEQERLEAQAQADIQARYEENARAAEQERLEAQAQADIQARYEENARVAEQERLEAQAQADIQARYADENIARQQEEQAAAESEFFTPQVIKQTAAPDWFDPDSFVAVQPAWEPGTQEEIDASAAANALKIAYEAEAYPTDFTNYNPSILTQVLDAGSKATQETVKFANDVVNQVLSPLLRKTPTTVQQSAISPYTYPNYVYPATQSVGQQAANTYAQQIAAATQKIPSGYMQAGAGADYYTLPGSTTRYAIPTNGLVPSNATTYKTATTTAAAKAAAAATTKTAAKAGTVYPNKTTGTTSPAPAPTRPAVTSLIPGIKDNYLYIGAGALFGIIALVMIVGRGQPQPIIIQRS